MSESPTTRLAMIQNAIEKAENKLASLNKLAADAGARKLRLIKEGDEKQEKIEKLIESTKKEQIRNKKLKDENKKLSDEISEKKRDLKNDTEIAEAKLKKVNSDITFVEESNAEKIAAAKLEAEKKVTDAEEKADEIIKEANEDKAEIIEEAKKIESDAEYQAEKANREKEYSIERKEKIEAERDAMLVEIKQKEPLVKEVNSNKEELAKLQETVDTTKENIISLKKEEEAATDAAEAAVATQKKEEKEAQKLVADRLDWGRRRAEMKDFETELKDNAILAGIPYPFTDGE